MAEAAFDDVIHAPVRLRICGLLDNAEAVRFAVLRDTLQVSDATLSKHLKTLSEAGYVSVSRTAERRQDARREAWASLTDAGRRAFSDHIRALQEIVGTGLV